MNRFTLAALTAALTFCFALSAAGAASASWSPTRGMWLNGSELATLPTSGTAWSNVKRAADDSLGTASVADQSSQHDTRTLAAALVGARLQDEGYRRKAAGGISAAIGTEMGGRTLALGRNLVSYIIAADLIDLRSLDPALDWRFRAWLLKVRSEPMADSGNTLITVSQQRPSNWGTNANMSRTAVAIYLGDVYDLFRSAIIMRGWLGDRGVYGAFAMPGDGTQNWIASSAAPRYVDPPGTMVAGHDFGGALPAEMVRGNTSPAWPPVATDYPWAALSATVVQAELLSRAGYPDVYQWQSQSVRRTIQFLYDLSRQDPAHWSFPTQSSYRWIPWIVNHAYGTSFPVGVGVSQGFNMGWTDWTHARR